MKDLTKYCGVIPAFYACYDAEGNISTEGAKAPDPPPDSPRASRASMWAALPVSASTSTPMSARSCWKLS